jgi:hypothetical protein
MRLILAAFAMPLSSLAFAHHDPDERKALVCARKLPGI